MRLTMSVINQDGATNELSSGNWTECGYWLPEWFGASLPFVGDRFFCFSCMGDCRRISCTEKKKKKKRRFIRFGDILAFFHSIFFSPWISKDALFNGCFNVYKAHVISIFDNVHEKLSLLIYVKTQEI